ncbi:MAG: tRNA lysidine(34) synthetase TilS, partial [Alphaproteobacteria bacterium]
MMPASIESTKAIAVAVSGGADSIALLHKLKDQHNGSLTALTVDHGLRPESRQEAETVAGWMTQLGIPHHILTWTDEKPKSGIQEQAREARYTLMTDWCKAHDIDILALAHHADDQAETFIHRLCRGSGLDGLAAMAPSSYIKGIKIIRPLLSTPKEELISCLRQKGVSWIEDPSNQKEDYTRVRIRKILRELKPEGLTTDRILKLTERLRSNRDVMDQWV